MAALDPFDQTEARAEQAGDGRTRPLVQPTPLEPGPPQVQPPLGVRAAMPTAPACPLAPPGVAPQPTGARPILVRVAAGTVIRPRDEGRRDEGEFTSVALRNSPPWLVSAAFHMLLLIILGLLAMSIQDRSQVNLNFTPVYAEQLGEQLEFDAPFGTDLTDAAEEPIFSISDLPEVPDPFAAPTNLEIYPDGAVATSDIEAPSIGLAFTGREEGAKKTLLGRYGGTALTQAAVGLGLEWLARNQWKDGSWSLNGPYNGGIPKEFDNPVAATAMALLAFQGDGNTHQKGKFRPNVARGWNWLLREQDGNGNFFHEGAFNHHFYTQGMCTIALCELYGMTKDPKYKETAQKAVQYCLDSQSPEGGWRYAPRSDSDVSVTGWIVMALQSAKMAGLEVPEDHFRRVERFLDKVAREDGSRYPYQRGGEIKLSMTAEALLCRQYLGWDRHDPRLVAGVEWITSPENLVNFNKDRDVYTWYYTTQVAHHMEGDYWKRWNAVMRQALPEQQVQHGRENGSWDPEKPTMDQWAPHGGRLYVTCLSLYMLEVYYRHLPIYSKIYTDLLKSGRAAGR
jgi:hypothetical protein